VIAQHDVRWERRFFLEDLVRARAFRYSGLGNGVRQAEAEPTE
jgi:hypothetical protein